MKEVFKFVKMRILIRFKSNLIHISLDNLSKANEKNKDDQIKQIENENAYKCLVIVE